MVFTTMLSDILLFTFEVTSPDQVANAPPLFSIGPLKVSSFAVTTGVISALITIPVNFVVIFVFSKRKLYVPKASRNILNTTERYRRKCRQTRPLFTGVKHADDEEDDRDIEELDEPKNR